MRWFTASLLILSLSGCISGRIRAEAAPVLACAEDQLQLEERQRGTWLVTGCERAAICVVPDVEGADVRCAGGGPTTRPPLGQQED